MIVPNCIAEITLALKDEYFDLQGLNAYSKLGVSTLREYIRKKGLPSFKVNGKILVRRSEFDEWLEGFRLKKEQDLEALADEVIEDLKT